MLARARARRCVLPHLRWRGRRNARRASALLFPARAPRAPPSRLTPPSSSSPRLAPSLLYPSPQLAPPPCLLSAPPPPPQRVYSKLLENNPELLGREKKRLKPPQVSRVGTTRTAWTNFKDICAGLKRTPDHILSFYLAELGTTGAIDGSDRLLLKGKYMPKYIESLLRKYIAEFVQCHMCRNVETDLRRDNVSRLFFMDCKACGSSRSVAPTKAGFHATSKGERRTARDAASN